jgi:hypothetical protein
MLDERTISGLPPAGFPMNGINPVSVAGIPKPASHSGSSLLPTGKGGVTIHIANYIGVSLSSAALEDRINKLADEWEEKSIHYSSIERMCMLPEYQEILALGWSAVGPLLRRMQKNPDWWFWALRYITGDDPVPASARGDLTEMTKAWIQWGSNRKLI